MRFIRKRKLITKSNKRWKTRKLESASMMEHRINFAYIIPGAATFHAEKVQTLIS